jgi:2-polyprenyl-6-methoxyphenol hydroxylase-like FAD-dependent oxidoreductase
LTGQGIGDAFRDAELLAGALATGGRQALEQYEQRRNAAAIPMYDLTTQLAAFAPPAGPQLAVMHALRGNQAQTDRFFGVITGSIRVGEFFGPANLMRLLGPIGLVRTLASLPRRQADAQLAGG